MKTLFGCGTAMHTRRGQSALWRWWFYYRPYKDLFGATHYAFNNDGHDNLPTENFIQKHPGEQQPIPPLAEDLLTMIYWQNTLGRSGLYAYPGFWRSVLVLAQIAKAQEFDRLIFVEWDFFIISETMMREIGSTTTGLMTYWVPKYNLPESAFIFCGRDQLETLEQTCLHVLSLKQLGKEHGAEFIIPWTDVRKHRVGDRYPEHLQSIPLDADYCAQVPISKAIHKHELIPLVSEKCLRCGTTLAFNRAGLLACPVCSPTCEKTILD